MFESSTGAAGPLQLLRFERRSRFVILGAGGCCAVLLLCWMQWQSLFDAANSQSEYVAVTLAVLQ